MYVVIGDGVEEEQGAKKVSVVEMEHLALFVSHHPDSHNWVIATSSVSPIQITDAFRTVSTEKGPADFSTR